MESSTANGCILFEPEFALLPFGFLVIIEESVRHNKIGCFCVCVSACLIGFLPLMGWSNDTDNGRVCWFIIIAPKKLVLLTVLVGGIALVIVIILNGLILRKAIKSIDTLVIISSNTTLRRNTTTQISQHSKWRATTIVTLTFGSFVITWGPYFVASLIYAYATDGGQLCEQLKSLIASPLAILGFLNSVLNPIIYAWWHKGFRQFIWRRFCKRGVTKQVDGNSSGSCCTTINWYKPLFCGFVSMGRSWAIRGGSHSVLIVE